MSSIIMSLSKGEYLNINDLHSHFTRLYAELAIEDFESLKKKARLLSVKPPKIDGVPRIKEDWIREILAKKLRMSFLQLTIEEARRLIKLILVKL